MKREQVEIEGIIFTKYIFFENKMAILLPNILEDMPKSMIDIQYPYSTKPEIIKTNIDLQITFTFSLYEKNIRNEEVLKATEGIMRIISNVYPSSLMSGIHTYIVNRNRLGWFDFEIGGMNGKIYNIMYIIPINNKLMLGTMNCPIEEFKKWKEIFRNIYVTITELNKIDICNK